MAISKSERQSVLPRFRTGREQGHLTNRGKKRGQATF